MFIKIFPCTVQGKQGRYRCRGLDIFQGCASRTRPPVDGDKVGSCIDHSGKILFNVAGSNLDTNGFSPGSFPEPLHLPFRTPSRLLISLNDAGLIMSTPWGYPRIPAISAVTFSAGRSAPSSGLCRLPDLDLDGIRGFQVFFGDAVPVRDIYSRMYLKAH